MPIGRAAPAASAAPSRRRRDMPARLMTGLVVMAPPQFCTAPDLAISPVASIAPPQWRSGLGAASDCGRQSRRSLSSTVVLPWSAPVADVIAQKWPGRTTQWRYGPEEQGSPTSSAGPLLVGRAGAGPEQSQ